MDSTVRGLLAMNAEIADALVLHPLLTDTSRVHAEMVETTETEMTGVALPHHRQISTAMCRDKTVGRPTLPSTLWQIQPSFLIKLDSPISANGGE